MTKRRVLGIDVGGTFVKVALVNEQGEIEHKWKIPTRLEDGGSHIASDVVASVERELGSLDPGETGLCAAGAGVPGAVRGHVVLRAVNLGWHDMPIGDELERALGVPCTLLNDANAAALGELWRGGSDGVVEGTDKNAVFVTLGTGVGGGIIIGGRVVNGANSCAGEIGHIPVRSDESRLCGCGKTNCLEAFASANGLLKTAQGLARRDGGPVPASCEEVFDLVRAGDPSALEALDVTVGHLAEALAGIMCTVDPAEVIVGGGLSNAGELLMEPLARRLDALVFPQTRGSYLLRRATLGNDAGVLGAARQALMLVG